ncbi:Gfo/Idh/MocA family oxidoreductase [Pelagibacteraceae bacterium]|nr:Gfo/Idh/MocA family oxidoreductase [Pelagibacteraceae bacterium]
MKFKVSFVGSGYMAAEHAKAFNDSNNFELVSVFSKTISNAKKFCSKFKMKNINSSIDDIYKKNKPDLLVISITETELRKILKKTLKYDWTILVEKPCGINLQDSKVINKLIKLNNGKIFVSLNRRYYSSSIFLKKKIKTIKDKIIIQINDNQDLNLAKSFNYNKKIIKNWMYANSIHNIDLFNYFGRGKITNVKNIYNYKTKNPFFVHSILSFSSGDIGVYTATWNMPGYWSINISSKDINYELKPIETLKIKTNKNRFDISEYKISRWDIDFKPGLRMQVDELNKYFQKHKYNLSTFNDSFETQKLINKIYKI